MATHEPIPQDRPEHRGPGRPRDARHDRAILEATLDILLEQGYGGLTIEGVAARAGVGRPTIYRRWPSKPALVVAALVQSAHLALPAPDTGSLRRDLLEVQRHQVERMNSPDGRRVTAGLVADLATDPELGDVYVTQYLAPRRAVVWQVLQRGIDRGELAANVDLAFAYDLLVGPLFMRAVVWGQPLAPEAAEQTADVILAAFPPSATRLRTTATG
ncbi:MAG TPA: TetR/AcrR family transcriptional regulator [Acidimicrobiia bacterium]|nr:TetR/AcrR family transcriptional regulator [Acidimicrobiia bacterium]